MTITIDRKDLAATQELLDLQDGLLASGLKGFSLRELGYEADDLDLSDFQTRIRLAAQGIYSIDRKAHRAARNAQQAHEELIASAYLQLGLDRGQEYRKIARQLHADGKVTPGIWVTSTGAYVGLRDARDAEVLAQADAPADLELVDATGTIWLIRVRTATAKAWLDTNVTIEDWAWMGCTFAIEPRFVEQLLQGAQDDGLKVAA